MLIFKEFFKTQSDQNIYQNAPINCTKFSKASSIYAPERPSICATIINMYFYLKIVIFYSRLFKNTSPSKKRRTRFVRKVYELQVWEIYGKSMRFCNHFPYEITVTFPHEIRTCTYMESTRNPHETRTCTNMKPTRNPHKIRTFTYMEPTRNPYMYPYMEPTRNP